MKAELGRKITSLTLMTIMFAGALTFAIPSALPAAEGDAKLLFVSCENEEWANQFKGAQICEVIVKDPVRADTDVAEGEPIVEVNGDALRMAQANDGYWYAYIVDTAGASTADSNANIDFGTALSKGGDLTNVAIHADSTVYKGGNILKGEPELSDYYAGTANKTAPGQINITAAEWPFIQGYDFTIGDVEIVLEKPGSDESVLLDYSDLDDVASFSVDRQVGPPGGDVHIEIRDNQLNIDPTEQDTVMFRTAQDYGVSYNASQTYAALSSGFGDNGVLKVTLDAAGTGTDVFAYDVTLDDTAADEYLIFYETGTNTGVFVNTDDADAANLNISTSALRGTTGTVDYNDSAQSVVVGYNTGSANMDADSVGEEWNSGENLMFYLTDGDRNLNTASDEDLFVKNTTHIPTITTGSPQTITWNSTATHWANATTNYIDPISKIAKMTVTVSTYLANADNEGATSGTPQWINPGVAVADWLGANSSNVDRVVAWDLSAFAINKTVSFPGINGHAQFLPNKGSLVVSNQAASATGNTADSALTTLSASFNATQGAGCVGCVGYVALNYMSFGESDWNGVYNIEVEESGDNTGVFEGDIEYVMANNLNYDNIPELTYISDSVTMWVNADQTGTDAPRVKYNDTDSDGVVTPIADQVDAPTHSGTVTFDSDSYKVADTMTITVTDMDLNTDSELIDVYITQADDRVGDNDDLGTHILDVYFADTEYNDDCGSVNDIYGLTASGFQLTETDIASGIFTGTFQVPTDYCTLAFDAVAYPGVLNSTTGTDIFVNYNDFRDAGGNEIETGDASTVSANTGSVALDRSVYPVPYDDATNKAHDDTYLAYGNITVTVQVTDPDYDVSATGEDTIPAGKVTIKGYRGTASNACLRCDFVLTETEASSGVFEYEFTLNATDKINAVALRQGDVITAEYNDPTDASGNVYLVTDSSTLDLRTATLMSDKSVYVIGSDAIITLVEPDLNLDSDSTESYTLGLVEWDSDAATVNLNDGSNGTFDPEPSKFRETGSDTGIFQVVIEIPTALDSENLDRGEVIDLEYVDHGPSGEANVGDDTEDVELTIYTSNFGATVELDSKVYTWTDRVFVTIVAPDHNTDSALVDEIGGDSTLTAQTRDSNLTNYKLVETGVDTGIFIGEITLVGFAHDADGDTSNDAPVSTQVATAAGPTDGYLGADESDGVTVSFEYTEDSTVVSSSLIRWNIGETSFTEDAYLSSSSAVIRVLDPDMNLNPDSVENFKIDVYSDSDSGGIELTVSETNESTGIFEGTIFFTTSDASGGHTLRVSEGDTITAEYSDHTLPEPYTTSDDIDVSATAVIGTTVPPLERAPVANARVVDAFGNSLAEVSVDQQVQIEADLTNGQDDSQSFAYLVQVQDGDGVTVSLAWITGSLAAGQSLSPALSWIPDASGTYEATVFVWESVDNPTALSDTTSVTIQVV